MPNLELGDREGGTTDRLLGELIAEVRAVKHDQRNAMQKLDGVNHLIEQVKDIKAEQTRHGDRLTLLEADRLRREGAVGLVEWISRHWPFTVLISFLAGWVAWANGKLHP